MTMPKQQKKLLQGLLDRWGTALDEKLDVFFSIYYYGDKDPTLPSKLKKLEMKEHAVIMEVIKMLDKYYKPDIKAELMGFRKPLTNI